MIITIKNTWADFWDFIKDPKDEPYPIQPLKVKSKRLLSILAIEFPLMIIMTVILSSMEDLGFFDMSSHKADKLLQNIAAWQILLFGAFIIPIIEEIFFRLHLRIKHNYPLKFLILISLITGKKNKKRLQIFIENKWANYYKVIFYLSALTFGLIHITNFEFSLKLLIFSPILTMPQILMGLLIGYMRMKFGFIWGLYLHSIHNLVLIIILLTIQPMLT
jgi:membrane protease YdiL (CAAX protease family)